MNGPSNSSPSEVNCKYIWIFLFCFLTHLTKADLTVIQLLEDMQNETPIRTEQTTLYVSGKRIRFDQGQKLSSIILNDKKVTFSITHEAHQYFILPHDQIHESDTQHAETPSSNGLNIQSTGKFEQINGYHCHQVRVQEKKGSLTELWVADDALDLKTFLSEFKSFMELGLASFSQEIDKHPELRGIPVRIIEYEGTKMIRRATIQQVNTTKLPDSLFEVPAGYLEIKDSDFSLPSAPIQEESKIHQ